MTDSPSARDEKPVSQPNSQARPTALETGNGRFKPGNTAALRHGRYSKRVEAGQMPELADAAAALPEDVSAIVADLGGAEAVGTLKRDNVQRYTRLGLVEHFLWRTLETIGPLSATGRPRAALSSYLAVVDRLNRMALALGLERTPKPVHASPREWLESLHQDAEGDDDTTGTEDQADEPGEPDA